MWGCSQISLGRRHSVGVFPTHVGVFLGKGYSVVSIRRLPHVDRRLFSELDTANFVREPANVLMVGPCGVGKSHVAQALGHAAAREGHDVLMATPAQLLGSLQTARATLTYDRRFQTLCKVPLLIVDDFLLKPLVA